MTEVIRLTHDDYRRLTQQAILASEYYNMTQDSALWHDWAARARAIWMKKWQAVTRPQALVCNAPQYEGSLPIYGCLLGKDHKGDHLNIVNERWAPVVELPDWPEDWFAL